MTTFHGYTEPEEKIEERLARLNAAHAARLAEVEERRQAAQAIADELQKTLKPYRMTRLDLFVRDQGIQAAVIGGFISVGSALFILYIVEAVAAALGGL